MIRYAIPPATLIAAIDTVKPGWTARARARKDAYALAKMYAGGSEFWGDIKDVYIDLQHEKCAYCEMKLAGKHYASKVHEVEHFRPKSRVRAWPGQLKRLAGYVPPCTTGAENASGYYLLAYNPFNYAIACTRCNSSLKSDYFPVKGTRSISEEDVGKLSGEEPLLIYPISSIDVDPESLITFIGVTAVPANAAGPDFERARVTIDFFQLNHEDLTTRRAEVVGEVYMTLKGRARETDPGEIDEWDAHLQSLVSAKSAFSACAKAYLRLYQTDRGTAVALGREAEKLRPR